MFGKIRFASETSIGCAQYFMQQLNLISYFIFRHSLTENWVSDFMLKTSKRSLGMSRAMMFYKIVDSTKESTTIQFRRLESGLVSDFLPEPLRGDIEFSNPFTPDMIDRFVRSSGWVLGMPVSSESEIGAAVLRGR